MSGCRKSSDSNCRGVLAYRTNNASYKGSRNNKFLNLGRRGARLARRGNAVIFIIFQVFATPPDGMDRRTKTGSYCFASPKEQLTVVALRSTVEVRGVTRRTKKVRPKIQARENDIPRDAKIVITIAPSLLDHFTENLSRQNPRMPPEEAITRLIAAILDSSAFPVEAKQTGGGEIRIAYHLRSFSQPIFWT